MKKFAQLLVLLLLSPIALGQGVTIGTGSGGPGATASVDLGYAQENSLRAIQIVVSYDNTNLTPRATSGSVDGCPVALGGVNWDPSQTTCNVVNDPLNPGTNVISITVSTGSASASPALDALSPFGTITFDIDANAPVGSTLPIEVDRVVQAFQSGSATNDPSLLTTADGSITIAVPVGESFYSSDPSVASLLDFGSAVVGSATSPDETIEVSNLSSDTDFELTNFDGTFDAGSSGSYSVTSPATGTTVAANGSVNVNVNCTPDQRGVNEGDFTITNTSNNQATATYVTRCTGLAPNVQVSDTSIILNGILGDTPPTGSINVLNPAGNFTSDANNVSVVTTTDAPEITAASDALQDATISVDEVDSLGYQCSTTAEGNFTEEFEIQYDDPETGGTASTATVTVTCNISDTAPLYGSDPTPGTALSFSADFGTTSAAEPIDVFNANSNTNADDLTISSATASDPVFNVNLINTTFAPDSGGAADGTTDIEVSCSPTGVGLVTGTLTVESNDGTQSYPLECDGTGESLTTTPAAGGTLNLGSVPPNTTTPEGSILFTNNDLNDAIDVTCTVSDPDGVFTAMPDPLQFTVAPGATESAVFQCTPPQVESYSAAVSCSGQFVGDYSVTCSGRPLVIPTLSNWGLILLSLVLLTIGGLVGRRMLG